MKRLLIFIAVIAVTGVGIWGLSNYRSSNNPEPQPMTEAEQEVLAIKDKRLTKGSQDAPVKIVEYADILCPYCARTHQETLPQVQSDYIDKQQAHLEVRLVAVISPDSKRAGEGAYCAAEQDKFWDYLDLAYQDTWDNYYSQNKKPQDVELFKEQNIYGFADRLGLNTHLWQACMDEGKYSQTLQDNQAKMAEMEAYGTPHFIINGSSYKGAPPPAAFKAVIETELNKAKDKS